MVLNDTSRVVSMTIVSDTTSCGVTYDHHSDSRSVIYAPRVVNYANIEHLQYRSSFDHQNIFIVQTTGVTGLLGTNALDCLSSTSVTNY
jgi:hypothetical protein